MSTQSAIHTEGLTKHYGKVEALNDLDLDIRPGEIFGFLGPNGAGKTTTIRTMMDEIRATPIDSVGVQYGPGSPNQGRFRIPALETDGTGAIAGRVIVIMDETMTDAEIGMPIGMPRDLDGDGEATNTDVSLSALVLPVVVQAAWGPPGKREFFRVPVVLIR